MRSLRGAPVRDTAPQLRPLTEAQEGLWYAQALDRGNPIFNAGQYITLTGPLDVAAFAAAHAEAVAQSPALALRFGLREGRPVQWLAAPPELRIVAATEAEAHAQMAADSKNAKETQSNLFIVYITTISLSVNIIMESVNLESVSLKNSVIFRKTRI